MGPLRALVLLMVAVLIVPLYVVTTVASGSRVRGGSASGSFNGWLVGHGPLLVLAAAVWFVLWAVGFGVAAGVLTTWDDWTRGDVLLLGVATGVAGAGGALFLTLLGLLGVLGVAEQPRARSRG